MYIYIYIHTYIIFNTISYAKYGVVQVCSSTCSLCARVCICKYVYSHTHTHTSHTSFSCSGMRAQCLMNSKVHTSIGHIHISIQACLHMHAHMHKFMYAYITYFTWLYKAFCPYITYMHCISMHFILFQYIYIPLYCIHII